jgi:DNA-directed RNA polymerase
MPPMLQQEDVGTGPGFTEPLGSVSAASSQDAQIQWEHEQVQRGIRRYRASLQKVRQDGSVAMRDLVDLEPGTRIASDLIGPMIERVRTEQLKAILAWEDPRHRKAGDAEWVLLALPTETLAATAVLHALGMFGGETSVKWTGACMSLGSRLKHEYDYARWKAAEFEAAKADPAHLNMAALMRARNKEIDARVFRKWSKKSTTLAASTWDSGLRIQAGSALLTYLVESNGWFKVSLKRDGDKKVRFLELTEIACAFVADRHNQNELMRPYLLPMICEPTDYAYQGSKLSGGYVTLKTRAVKGSPRNSHTEALERPVGPRALEGLNWVQKTKWRINRHVLSVAEQMIEEGISCPEAGVPSMNDQAPPKMPQIEFDALSDEERKTRIREREAIYSANASARAVRTVLFRRVALAQELSRFRDLWFPHFLDFRGRVYPLPQDLTPQGDSLCKGLLEFSAAKPVDARGMYWLQVAFANAMGHDKLSLDERVAWANSNFDAARATALDPLSHLDFWAGEGVDSPWEALALSRALIDAADGAPVHVPVRLDATCSGIQHLAALMRDPLSARCVNLADTGKREDIYGDVAANAANRVALDAARGNELAMLWLGNVTRKTVKRAVMTTPYGVTPRGISVQLVLDGFCKHIPEPRMQYKAADYLREVIVASLDENIGRPREAMRFFQDVALSLAERGVPMKWRTPADMTVLQAYYGFQQVIHLTLAGKVAEYRENTDLGLVGRKQALASAPNVIHSFDAAHLMRTVIRCKAEEISDLALVHDSFGTHAADIDTLNRLLREEFVSIYSAPALEQWRDTVVELAGVQDLPAVPQLGAFDVTEVLKSPFFFS